jgi:DNA modification methylase
VFWSKNNFYKEQIAQPYLNPEDRRIRKRISNGGPGRMPYSWMHHNLVKNVAKEKTFHACQIPQVLTEMIIKSCTKEGGSVFVLFGGSGSEVEVAKKLIRNYLTCEMKSDYYEVICDRSEGGKIKN